MVEHARIFYAEDSSMVRRSLKRLLEDLGHQVVIEAETLEDALANIKTARDLGVRVAIVDGNLSPHDLSCNDGRVLSAALKEAIPNIFIIANSGTGVDPGYGDVVADKLEMGTAKLILDSIASLEN